MRRGIVRKVDERLRLWLCYLGLHLNGKRIKCAAGKPVAARTSDAVASVSGIK